MRTEEGYEEGYKVVISHRGNEVVENKSLGIPQYRNTNVGFVFNILEMKKIESQYTAWSAVVALLEPAGLQASVDFAIFIACNGKIVFSKVFRIGDALNTSKFKKFSDLEAALEKYNGSKDLKFAVLATIANFMLSWQSMEVETIYKKDE